MSDPVAKRPKSSGGSLKDGASPCNENAKKKSPPPPTKPLPGVLLPELPATVWGKHIAPFLSRKQQNRLILCRKEILKAMEGIDLRWPTIELEYPDTSRYNNSEYPSNDNSNNAVTAFTHDSKYLVLAPIPGGNWGNPCPGLYVWNIRSGLQTGIAHNMNRNNVHKLTTAPETILFSGDDRYLAVHRCEKIGALCVRHDIYDVYKVIQSETALSLEFVGERSVDEMQKTLGFSARPADEWERTQWYRAISLSSIPFRHPNPDVRIFDFSRNPTNPNVYFAKCRLPVGGRRSVHTLELIECTSTGGEVADDYTSTKLTNMRVKSDPATVWHPDGEHIVWYDAKPGRFHILNPFAMQKKKGGGGRKRGSKCGDDKDAPFSPPHPWAKLLIEKANTVIQRWCDDDECKGPYIDHSFKFSPDGSSMVLTVGFKTQILISIP